MNVSMKERIEAPQNKLTQPPIFAENQNIFENIDLLNVSEEKSN